MKRLVLSVLIVTKNREADLKDCLKALAGQTTKPDELIIVENNNEKTLTKIVKNYKKYFHIKYLLQDSINISQARNTALENATGDILAFVDDDCIVAKDWVYKIHEFFINNQNTIGIIGRSLNFYKKNKLAQLEQLLQETWFSLYFKLNKTSKLTSGMFVNTRNLVIRKSILGKYKIKFDPNVPHKIEDTDFGIRLFNFLNPKKEQVYYQPDLLAYHKNSQNLFQFLSRRNASRKGKKWLLKKYPDFEKSVPTINPSAFKKLQERSLTVKILFFIERQYIRTAYVLKKVRGLLKNLKF